MFDRKNCFPGWFISVVGSGNGSTWSKYPDPARNKIWLKKKKGGFDRISPSDAKFSFLCDVTGTSNVVKLKFVCGCQA
jgi:hypothetical protein